MVLALAEIRKAAFDSGLRADRDFGMKRAVGTSSEGNYSMNDPDGQLFDLQDDLDGLYHRKKYFCDDCAGKWDSMRLEAHGTPCTLTREYCRPGDDCLKEEEYCDLEEEIEDTLQKVRAREGAGVEV
jgi:hypothetical protein